MSTAAAGAIGAAPAAPGPHPDRPAGAAGRRHRRRFVGLSAALTLPGPATGLAPGRPAAHPARGPGPGRGRAGVADPARHWAAPGFGALAGVLVVLRIVNAGFAAVLDRPFDPLGDWGYFGSGVGVLGDSIGDATAPARCRRCGAPVAVVVVGLAWSAVRVTRVAADHRPRAARGVLALGSPGRCAQRPASTSRARTGGRGRGDGPRGRHRRPGPGLVGRSGEFAERSGPTGSPTSPPIGC